MEHGALMSVHWVSSNAVVLGKNTKRSGEPSRASPQIALTSNGNTIAMKQTSEEEDVQDCRFRKRRKNHKGHSIE